MNFYLVDKMVVSESEIPSNLDIKKLYKFEAHCEGDGANSHIPYVEILNDCIKVRCGKNECHPMVEGHHLVWYKLEIDGVIIDTVNLNIDHTPESIFMISNIEASHKKIRVHALCNTSGVWSSPLIEI